MSVSPDSPRKGQFNSDEARYGGAEETDQRLPPPPADRGATSEAIEVEDLDAENDGGAG